MKVEFITRKKDASCKLLLVKGELTVSQSTEFKDQLLKIVQSDRNLELSLTEVELLDVSAIQLIYIVKKKLEDTGRKFYIHLPRKEDQLSLLKNTGLSMITSQSTN